MCKYYDTRNTAIVTKYLAPTNTKGARIKADAGMGRTKTVPFDHGTDNPHLQAAKALCGKMGWHDRFLIQGGTETGAIFLIADSFDLQTAIVSD